MWRRWATLQNLFGIYWWTWKTTIYWKQCWNRSIKNGRILEFKMLFKKKKKRRKTPRDIIFYTCGPKILMIWSTVLEIECDRLKLVIMGHFSLLPVSLLTPPPKKKEKKKKKWSKIAGNIIISHCVSKTTIIWGTVPEIQSETHKKLKKWKSHLDMSSFYPCVKSWSYDI